MTNLCINIYENDKIIEELTKYHKQIFISLNLEYPFNIENNNLLRKDSQLSKIAQIFRSKGRGRPKGNKNKPKNSGIIDPASVSLPRLKRGRPKGQKNKPTVEQQVSSAQATFEHPKRDRPQGSKNKPTAEQQVSSAQATFEHPKRGRPQGSKN
jgi:hypothetical protein